MLMGLADAAFPVTPVYYVEQRDYMNGLCLTYRYNIKDVCLRV